MDFVAPRGCEPRALGMIAYPHGQDFDVCFCCAGGTRRSLDVSLPRPPVV